MQKPPGFLRGAFGRGSALPRVDDSHLLRVSNIVKQDLELRAAVFIDGFNLYHAIDSLGKTYLKWSNYWRMAEMLIDSSEELALVVTATAYFPDTHKRSRHERHVKALESVGVKVLLGHYVEVPSSCRTCGASWNKPTEKQGDINIALALIDAAYQDQFDRGYLITADSDHAATAHLFTKRFPEKSLVSVAPPGRHHARAILSHIKPAPRRISLDILESSVFGLTVPNQDGTRVIHRPYEYDPPVNWTHPDFRV